MGQNLRYTLRQLRRSWPFTATVVLTLAIGIGLNATIFTVVDCVLLRPLGYRDANRIYSINTRFLKEGRSINKMGGDDYVDVARQIKGFEYVAHYNAWQDGVQVGGHTLYTSIAVASPDFGEVLGVLPAAGRLFSKDATENEALVGAAFARSSFGSIEAALGAPLLYNGKPRTIVGVLPDGFAFPAATSIWIKQPPIPDTPSRTAYNQRAIGKVRPGVGIAALNAELATLSRQLSAAYPDDHDKAIEAISLQEQIVGRVRPVLGLMMASVAVVLIIVCANLTHLYLVRGTRQQRDITLRMALGATRAAMLRHALREAFVLAAFGTLGGLLLAIPALRLLTRMATTDIPRLADVHLNLDVLAFSFAVSFLTMIAASLLPVWRAWSVDPASAMKQDSQRGTESRRSGRLRDSLVVAEVALTLTLSVAAVLLTRQLMAEARADLGFSPDNLVTLETHAPPAPETNPQLGVVKLQTMIDQVRTLPGVKNAAAISGAPMSSSNSDVLYAIAGKTTFTAGANLPDANILPISGDYFQTMRIPLLSGRIFTPNDSAAAPPVIVISKQMAAESFPGENPIGRQIMCGFERESSWWTIVGVVGDVRQESPASAPYPSFYVPIAQHPRVAGDVQLVVRTTQDATAMLHSVQAAVEKNDPTIAISSATMQQRIGESSRAQRFRTTLFGSFAALSILLAAIGMYGVTSYSVAQRRFEFALRVALGADRRHVIDIILRRALQVAALGIVLGGLFSLVLARVFVSQIGSAVTFDTSAYMWASLTVLVIVLAAALPPMRRAATVDPMHVLRTE